MKMWAVQYTNMVWYSASNWLLRSVSVTTALKMAKKWASSSRSSSPCRAIGRSSSASSLSCRESSIEDYAWCVLLLTSLDLAGLFLAVDWDRSPHRPRLALDSSTSWVDPFVARFPIRLGSGSSFDDPGRRRRPAEVCWWSFRLFSRMFFFSIIKVKI